MMILSAKEKICIVSAFWGGPNDTLAPPISRLGGAMAPWPPPWIRQWHAVSVHAVFDPLVSRCLKGNWIESMWNTYSRGKNISQIFSGNIEIYALNEQFPC